MGVELTIGSGLRSIDLFMIWLDLIISLTGVWTGKKIHRKRHLSGLGVARSRDCREKIQSMRSAILTERRLANRAEHFYIRVRCTTNTKFPVQLPPSEGGFACLQVMTFKRRRQANTAMPTNTAIPMVLISCETEMHTWK